MVDDGFYLFWWMSFDFVDGWWMGFVDGWWMVAGFLWLMNGGGGGGGGGGCGQW